MISLDNNKLASFKIYIKRAIEKLNQQNKSGNKIAGRPVANDPTLSVCHPPTDLVRKFPFPNNLVCPPLQTFQSDLDYKLLFSL